MELVTPEGNLTFGGSGYEVAGMVYGDLLKESIRKSIQIFNLCNDAQVHLTVEDSKLTGDPPELSLKIMAIKAGLAGDTTKRLAVIPFDSAHKFMAILVRDDQKNLILVKGAPEKILERCALTSTEKSSFTENFNKKAAEGYRIIASAWKQTDSTMETLTDSEITDLHFVGFACIIDPPRPEASEAIARCHEAGITVKMITGGYVETACAIARNLGIKNPENKVEGKQLESLSEEDWKKIATSCNVFARTTPQHKLRLVEALQAQNRIVAMTGDKVNDAPALKKANIGVAMGIKGTQVTKDVSDIILTDDNFATIAHAVKLGRGIYDNIRKAIIFILPTNAAEAISILAALLAGGTLPITAPQILWINMVTTVTLALALAFEHSEDNVMKRPPRNPSKPILDTYLVWRILFVGGVLSIIVYALFNYALKTYQSIDLAGTIAVNALVAGEIFYLLYCKHIRHNVFDKSFFNNVHIFWAIGTLVILQLAFSYLPFFQDVFKTVPLASYHFGLVLLGGLLLFLIVEFEKFIMIKLLRLG